MSSSITSRFEGFNADVAFKAPVRVVSTSVITLSGLQAIDGITVAANDRVLVTGQTSAIDNGIWVAGSGAWSRAQDFNGTYDVAGGTVIRVNQGTSYANTFWTVSGNGAKVIGTDALTISRAQQPFYGLTVFTPEAYGAVEGSTAAAIAANNTAFAALNAALTANGGGIVEMYPGRTYVVGKQTANTNGFRFDGANVLYGLNLRHFIVRGNGATLKMAPGLYFGGYTSAVPPVATTNPANANSAERADQGILLRASGCDLVYVENLFLDGNCANGIVGGPWADTGRQCVSYGLHIFECDNVLLDAVNAYDWLLDGFAIGYTGLTAASDIKPTILRNCISQRSGRNCISIVGGNGVELDNCYFEDAGNALNTVFGRVTSAPASACDWESELSVIRSGIANNTTFYSGLYGNTAVVAGSGDTRGITFNDCRFDGNIFMQKPEIVFNGGVINGQFGALYGGQTRRSDNTIIRGMTGSDVALSGRAIEGDAFITGSDGSGANVVIERCDFTLAVSKFNVRDFILDRVRVTFTCGTDTFANQDFIVLAEGANMRNVTLVDSAGTTASDPPTVNEGYYVITSAATVAYNCLIVASANYTLKWNSSLGGGGGYPRSGRADGRFDNGLDRFQGIMLQREANFGGGENEWASIVALNASPSVGSYKLGSLVINTTTSSGGIWAWTQSGGAFVPVGIVGAVQCAAQADFAGADLAAVKVELNALLAKLRTSKLIAT